MVMPKRDTSSRSKPRSKRYLKVMPGAVIQAVEPTEWLLILSLAREYIGLSDANIPIDALFVTPADFVYHAKNLRQIDAVNIFE